MQSVGVHIPGVLNHYADEPSRAAEKLYDTLEVAESCCLWVNSLHKPQVVGSVHGVQWGRVANRYRKTGNVALFIPPPHTRQAMLHEAVDMAVNRPDATVLVLLPVASYSDERWIPIMSRLKTIAELPASISIYKKRVEATDVSWCEPVAVESRPKGRWLLWRVV